MAKQPKKLGGTPDEAQNELEKYLKLLRDYQNVVFAVVVLALTAGVLLVWHHQRGQEQEDAAWAELATLQQKDVDKMKPVVDKYDGTAAHPFLVLAYTAKLYDKGGKEELEQAKTLLEHARDEASGNKLVAEAIEAQLKGIRGELADAKLWADAAQVGSGAK